MKMYLEHNGIFFAQAVLKDEKLIAGATFTVDFQVTHEMQMAYEGNVIPMEYMAKLTNDKATLALLDTQPDFAASVADHLFKLVEQKDQKDLVEDDFEAVNLALSYMSKGEEKDKLTEKLLYLEQCFKPVNSGEETPPGGENIQYETQAVSVLQSWSKVHEIAKETIKELAAQNTPTAKLQKLLTGLDDQVEQEAHSAKPPEAHVAKLIDLFDVLSDYGVTSVSVDYSGSGDSGGIDGVVFMKEDKIFDAMDLYKDAGHTDDSPQDLENAVSDLAMGLVEHQHGGWENNNGGGGEVIFDVQNERVEVNHYDWYMEAATSYDEYQL